MASNRLLGIQALRALAVLLVASVHVVNAEARYGGGGAILPQWLGLLGHMGVDIFFVISGFVMVTVTFARQERPGIGRYIYHRITRIYPTYWFYSLIVLAVFLVRPEMVNSSQGSQVNILESFLILPQDRLPLVMVGWALEHEMYFYAAFALTLLMPRRALAPALTAWAAAVGLGYYYAAVSSEVVLASPAIRLITHPLTFEFIVGCALAMAVHAGIRHGAKLALALGAALAAVSLAAIATRLGEAAIVGWQRPLLYGAPAALMVYGAAAWEMGSRMNVPGMLVRIGDASYSTFLSHILVISLVGRLWQPFAGPGMMDNLICTPLMYVALLLFGELSYRLIEEPATKLFRKIEQGIIRSA